MIHDTKTHWSNLLKRHLVAMVCFILLAASGCSSSVMKPYLRPDADFTSIRKVAVLPIENFTSKRFADKKIGSLIIIELLSRGIEVIEPGEVIAALSRQKIRSVSRISLEDIVSLGRVLNVDAVMIGSIETFSINRGISVSYPEVSINLTLTESEEGVTLWSVWHTTGGADFWTRHFGTEGRTLDEAASDVVREALDTVF